VTVRNTGARRGTAVPQVYLALPQPAQAIVQPPKQLRGMKRVALPPGASARVTFDLSARDLSYWDTATSSWKVAPGCYGVMVGRSSRDIAETARLAVGPTRGCAPPPCRRQRRAFTLPTGMPASRVNRVTVYVNGRRQRTFTGHRRTVRVKLPATGRARVRLVIRTVTGRRVVQTRTYGACAPRGRARHRA
jgi:hypothetical protein